MKLIFKLLLFIEIFILSLTGAFSQQVGPSYPIGAVPFTSVHINANFRAQRIHTNHELIIPIAIQKCRETGRIKNFKIVGKPEKGSFCTLFRVFTSGQSTSRFGQENPVFIKL